MYENEAADETPMATANVDAKAVADEALCVKEYLDEYRAARKFDAAARKNYAIDRRYASGRACKNWASDANLIGTFIDILVSFLYARDPDVSVSPSPHVGQQPPEDMANLAETLQIVISRLWKDGRLKKGARKAVRSALTVGPGWLKVLMFHETREDPEMRRQLNDTQDNIARLDAKRKELADQGLTDDELTVKQKEYEALEESLSEKLEVVFRKGLVIDFVPAESMQVSLSVREITDYLDSDWLADEMFVLKDEATATLPRLTEDDLRSAKCYYQRRSDTESEDAYGTENVRAEHADQFVAADVGKSNDDTTQVPFIKVIECWDKRNNHIYTMVDGIKKWAKDPFQPNYASSRFYPYFNLQFFEVDGDRHAQSLSWRLRKLQDEYSQARSSGRIARERSVPGTIFDNQKVTPEDAKKISSSTSQEYVGISPVSGDDIRKAFAEKPVGRYDPRIYDTEPILRDMERVSGVQEALQSAISQAKTATEAEIQQSGFASRTNADRDTLEEMLTDIAQYTAEISMQALGYDYVQKVAGELAFWPEGLPFEEIVTLVQVEIEAGTTGKPNSEQMRQNWSTVLPMIKETMMQVQQMMVIGNDAMAKALTELLRETLKRLDDRLPIDKFIPQMPTDPMAALAGGLGADPVGPGGGPAAPAGPGVDPGTAPTA